MTVWRSSFSDGAPGSWAANGEIATRRGRASRHHPGRREVPLGTRGLGFSWQSSAVVFRLLFLEATQLKTVRTAVEMLRDDPDVVEVQVVGTATPRRNRRRPDVPGVADAVQQTGAVSAAARGRAARHLKAGVFLGTVFTPSSWRQRN